MVVAVSETKKNKGALGWIASFVVLVAVTVFIGPGRIAAGSSHSALPADQAKMEWKKAKDKFLIEVKRLSQNPALSEQEKEVIRNIEKSWKGYDISFQKYVLASTKESFQLIGIWLGVLTALVVIGGGIFLLRDARKSSVVQVTLPGGGPSYAELAAQAEEIKKALAELRTLME
jgi:hypothetical protein